jgi:hypothetical protein
MAAVVLFFFITPLFQTNLLGRLMVKACDINALCHSLFGLGLPPFRQVGGNLIHKRSMGVFIILWQIG